MKRSLILFFLLFLVNICAGQLIDSAHINFTPYKGKLIVMNEAHAIASNDKVYEHLIRQIATQLSPGDTINIIIEQSYSVSYLQNNIVRGAGKGYGSLVEYTKGLPVKYIGVDFERIEKEKDSANTLFLSDIIIKLKERNIPTEQLKRYRDAIRSRNSDQSEARRSLITLYKKEQEKYNAGTDVSYTLEQLLFVLTAKYYYTNLRKRDKGNYERLLKADKQGLIRFRNNYNILIHGTCHTDPAMRHGIYRRFQETKGSPFKDNVSFIGQAYIDCISAKDFFRETPVQMTHSIFCDDIFSVTDHFREKYKGRLQPGNVIALPPDSSIPDVAQYKGRIIGWYLHWKVGVEK